MDRLKTRDERMAEIIAHAVAADKRARRAKEAAELERQHRIAALGWPVAEDGVPDILTYKRICDERTGAVIH